MDFNYSAKKCAYVVDKALRDCFPSDFYIRCLYASFGTRHLMSKMGYSAKVIMGSFGMIAVSPTKKHVSFQYFGGKDDPYSHIWCIVEGCIFDVGSSYLSIRLDPKSAQAPTVLWPLSRKMPKYFRYYHGLEMDVDESYSFFDIPVKEQMDAFLKKCDDIFENDAENFEWDGWFLLSDGSVSQGIKENRKWAKAAREIHNSKLSDRYRELLFNERLREDLPVQKTVYLCKST